MQKQGEDEISHFVTSLSENKALLVVTAQFLDPSTASAHHKSPPAHF